MSNKKRRIQSKAIATFAFALSLIASRSVTTISASAHSLPEGDMTRFIDERNSGGATAYTHVAPNTFVATSRSYSTYDFLSTLNGIKDFAVVANSLTSTHVEGTVCVSSINRADMYNTNCANEITNYVCYLDKAPEDTLMKFGVDSNTKYELVFGFDYEIISRDNSSIVFTANGQAYKIEINGCAENLSIRKASADEKITDINGTLDQLAETGAALMNDEECKYDASAEGSALRSALNAIADGRAVSGDTMIVNVHANELRQYENEIAKLLLENNGVRVIINVNTDGVTDVNFGNINAGDWQQSCQNVIFNFGAFSGNIYTPTNGGIFVAPYATFNNGGNINGAVIANTVNQNAEIHQITGDYEFSIDDDEDDPDDGIEDPDDGDDETDDDDDDVTDDDDDKTDGDDDLSDDDDDDTLIEDEADDDADSDDDDLVDDDLGDDDQGDDDLGDDDLGDDDLGDDDQGDDDLGDDDQG
ncbi:MAG: hypothetical protein J6A16_09050, partial [Oscillospiraceae bacterium]|nr:hypothetical protein [Oscillospiraceae bacterium]